MPFVTPGRAPARALSVAVLGAGLFSIGLWSLHAAPRPEPALAARAPITAAALPAAAPPAAVLLPAATPSGPSAQPRLIRAADVSLGAMSPFRLAGGAEARALECLTTAVYYEARGEGADGMAAVAQVVLNRVRHPAFPKSVCGVVFQGCQFSFACGGMSGRRNAVLWSRSREIAEAALGGQVMARVGTATHFHATRLNPRWAGLRRVATIGQHVFYSFTGRRGAPASFLEAASAGEPPRRATAPAVEAPAYAMLRTEQPGALSPLPSAIEAPAAAPAPEPTAEAVIAEPEPMAPAQPLSEPAPVV